MTERRWEPIATAPKDGTDVILSNGAQVALGRWAYEPACVVEIKDFELDCIFQEEHPLFEGWIDLLGGMRPTPTHWMPLPAPPKEARDAVPAE